MENSPWFQHRAGIHLRTQECGGESLSTKASFGRTKETSRVFPGAVLQQDQQSTASQQLLLETLCTGGIFYIEQVFTLLPSYPANETAPASSYLVIFFLWCVMSESYRLIFPFRLIMVQDMKVLTLLRMTALQMGHDLKLRAHSPQATRWPHGTNTTDTSLSRHTLHILSSCRRRSCSSVLIRDSSFW